MLAQLWLRDYVDKKSTEISHQIDTISATMASIDPQVAYAVAFYSLQTKANYVMATNKPSNTEAFSIMVDVAIERAFTRALGLNILDHTTSYPTDHPVPQDLSFVSDRAKLRTGRGGVGIRLLKERERALSQQSVQYASTVDRYIR